jgi:outer membrane protein insertion porin family
MAINTPGKVRLFFYLKNIFFISVLLSACTIPREYQKGKPFVFKNNIELKGGNFTKDEKITVLQRLNGQLDDSSRIIITDAFFFIHNIDNPPAYDSGYAAISAKNMKGSMMHLGYYNAIASFKADTITKRKIVISFRFRKKLFPWYRKIQKRVITNYTVIAGNPTLIDTISYDLKDSALQQLALQTDNKSFLAKNRPVSKDNINNEIGRLVQLFRNNGYYKFTLDDIKVIGDTTVSLLTNVSNDPFENLAAVEEAKEKRNKPTIKLAVVLNPAIDTNNLKKYYINNVYIYPDFSPLDTLNKTQFTDTIITSPDNYIIQYHKYIFDTGLLLRNMYFKKGDEYNQDNYSKTINNFSKTGVWQSVIVQINENKLKDSIDIIIQLFPAKKYGFEASAGLDYSTNSNTNTAVVATTGDLLGFSANASLQNRNIGKEAIKITHAINAGVELNLGVQNIGRRLNSNDLGYTNTISFPRLIPALKTLSFIPKNKKLLSEESFINTNISYVDRIDLFKLQNFSLAIGGTWKSATHPNRLKTFKPLNIEFSYLYGQTDSFKNTLDSFPYLRYSFNTALVMGMAYSYSSTLIHQNRRDDFKFNIEESGLIPIPPFILFGIFKNYLRNFVKADIEYTRTKTFPKSSRLFHFFAGMGIPIGSGASDSTLPFFKQYFSGGANSMRGWPVRGLGPGSEPLLEYSTSATTLNDQTGDIKLEMNLEYRYNIATIIPNTLSLKGALFTDFGNIWNFRDTKTSDGKDGLQFPYYSFYRFYKQIAADIGTGFRFDFNYFVLRFDLGFRIKRPDIAKDDGWQIPDITFDNLFKQGVNDENRIWRYENFNFTIGINYPF